MLTAALKRLGPLYLCIRVSSGCSSFFTQSKDTQSRVDLSTCYCTFSLLLVCVCKYVCVAATLYIHKVREEVGVLTQGLP